MAVLPSSLQEKEGRRRGLRIALATMSHRKEALKVLFVMGIMDQFECILTKNDVELGKPHPEIYQLAAQKLSLPSNQCLVLEDSVNGIKAAQSAGMPVFALTNAVTRNSVHEAQLLQREYILDDLTEAQEAVFDYLQSGS